MQEDLRHEAGVALQFRETTGDVGLCDLLQFVGAESFAGVAGGDAAMDDGLAKVFEGGLGFALAREPAGHATKEAIACAGGVEDGIERVSGAGEEGVGRLAEEVTAVFAALHHDEARAFGLELAACFHEIGSAGEFLGLAVIDHEEVDLFQHIMQALIGDADPEVHGIGDHKVGVGALLEGLQLVIGAHVCQHSDFSRRSARWHLRGPAF